MSQLQELAAGLRDLHQALLEAQYAHYQRTHGPIVGGSHLLHLAAHDPSFAWLRMLSALMVDLDGLLDQAQAPSNEEAGALRQELEETFSPGARAQQFWANCAPLLQAPRAAMAYARVRAVLARLPRPAAPDVAAELHAKHRWAVARRMRGTP